MPAGDGKVATEASVLAESEARADGDSANATAIQKVSVRMPDGEGGCGRPGISQWPRGRYRGRTARRWRGPHRWRRSLPTGMWANTTGMPATDVYSGTRTWQSVIAQGDRAVAKLVESTNVELGKFKASATRSIELIATEQAAQAEQIEHFGVDLAGKASAESVSRVTTRVEETEKGLQAFSGRLTRYVSSSTGKPALRRCRVLNPRSLKTRTGFAQSWRAPSCTSLRTLARAS